MPRVSLPEKTRSIRTDAMAAVLAVTGLAFEARIASGSDTHVICGGGGRALAGSLACAIAGDCRGLISFGLAGGLAPHLNAGTCIVASGIISGATQFMTDTNWSRNLLRALPGAAYGAILGVPTPVAFPETKHALHVRSGAIAVDMESHLVAGIAAARCLPLAAVRVITDSAMRALPPTVVAMMSPNGRIELAALIRAMIDNPAELPKVMQTALDGLVALTALRRTRHLLGPSFGLPDLKPCINLECS